MSSDATAQRHRVDERLAAGEGRVEHRLGDAELPGEPAHRCAAIITVGSRFLLQPRQATLAFGVAADNLRALTAIKGVRDITCGVVLLVIWAAAGRTALGWALIAVTLSARVRLRSAPRGAPRPGWRLVRAASVRCRRVR
jgi:hypothetical protein